MKISVEYDRCEGHGMCTIAAPEVFTLNDEGIVEYAHEGTELPEALVPRASFAADTCPVAALRIG